MKACKSDKITGNVHSIETFGTHEGPGIRFVVFLQGCLGRCLYCQNPDTWQEDAGNNMSAEEIMEKLNRCYPYIKSSAGGITVSGGEPLLQMDFLCSLFRLCKKRGVHTAIDTGAFFRPEDESKLPMLLSLTDLFIVDIKTAEKKLHKLLTSRNLDQVTRFIGLLEGRKNKYWIRYVLVPDLNDSARQLKKLGKVLSGFHYCVNFQFLPYHTYGRHKWDYLGLNYPLPDIKPATDKDIKRAERITFGRK
ncbi:MAG: pyruvate formate lyase-activating protein [Candidatus Omnitrophica bacterium]|nr:pyruvate formate lyase-activating protein [Candidatus Omnitrophota bacterium]